MKKKQPSSLVHARLIGILLCSAIMLLGWKLYDVSRRNSEMQTRISKLNAELNSVLAQEETFLNMKNFFESDFFAEREARLKYGMQKANEHAVIIQEGDQKTNQTSTVLLTESEGGGNSKHTTVKQMMVNIQRWLEYFFHTS